MGQEEQKVKDHIKIHRAKGYKQIKSALSKRGISKGVIKKHLSSSKILILFAVIVLGLAVLGYFIIISTECSFDSDCDNGFECIDGACKSITVDTFEIVDETDTNECLIDSDCVDGYECSDGVCENKKVEAQCGDGNCEIGEESCYLDCGCTTNDECEELGYDYCNSNGVCMDYSGGSGGGSSGTTSTSCVDTGCDSGYACDTTTGSCYDYCSSMDDFDINTNLGCDSGYYCSEYGACEVVPAGVACSLNSDCTDGSVCDTANGVCVACSFDSDCGSGKYCISGICINTECSDGLDNDGDEKVDYFGTCTLDSVVYLCNVSAVGYGDGGMVGQDKESCFFNYADGSEDYCDEYDEAVYSFDDDCESVDDDLEAECSSDSECVNEHACDTTTGDCYDYCDFMGDFDITTNIGCASGYYCSEYGVCEVIPEGPLPAAELEESFFTRLLNWLIFWN